MTCVDFWAQVLIPVLKAMSLDLLQKTLLALLGLVNWISARLDDPQQRIYSVPNAPESRSSRGGGDTHSVG